MLDDYSQMEKKPSGRPVQPAPKPGGTENKKSIDNTNKPFGKYNRRREPALFSNPKNEPPRKCNPSKGGKYADKRPKPHNQYFKCGKANSKVADDYGPELGSVFVSGRKNLNHLLNFQYTPRIISRSNVSWSQNSPPSWFATHKHKYNKEHFLQANCQFVVKQNADYTPHFVDPDLLVEWGHIEQIRLHSGALVSCPICLDIPVAAKITRCGHVYCWSCILHYLALSDKTWRKCPICYEAVHKNDLKSVITMAYSTYNVNEEITFKLMKRDRGSLLPIPVEECSRKVVTGLLSLNETDIDTTYSKLLLASPDDVMSIIQIERMELNSQLLDNEGCPEICFIEQALELLKEREESTRKSYEKEIPRDEINPNLEGKVDGQQTTNDISEDLALQFNATMSLREDDGFSRVRHESCGSEVEAINEDEHPNIAAEELEISNSTTTKPFYFYQASDGQHVYLHAMNIKMLELQYGALENCPHEIRGKILEKEGGSMTEGLRKRLRYLQHLPLTCQFEVAEINIAPLVSDDILATFRGQIEARVKRRNRRAREELKREKKINEEVNMMWGRKPAPKLRIESHRQFPLCGSGSEEAFPIFPPPSPSESSVPSRSQSVTSLSSVESPTLESIFGAPTTSQVTKSLENGPSFAQMLKEGTSRDCKRDTLRTERKWAPPVVVDSEGELEGYLPAPDFSQSFSDAIAVALEKANSTQDDTLNKKKKKKKQKVLFVTGMACSAK